MEDVVEELLTIDVVRGKHSTGLATISSGNMPGMVKVLGGPMNLLLSKEYADMKKKLFKVMIGHNRYATKGAIDTKNAHPFHCGKIIGVHNGTLDWHSDIKPAEDGTDSEAIFWHINDFGIEATVPKMSGAWALIWYDLESKTLNFLRNDQRPLYYCYGKDRKVMVWASEKRMLDFSFPKDKREHEEGTNGIYSPDSNMMLTWDMTQDMVMKPPVQTKLEGKKPTAYKAQKYEGQGYVGDYSYGASTGYYKNGVWTTNNPQTGGTKKSGSNVTPPTRVKDRRKKFRPPYVDIYGTVLTKKDFEEVVSEGCSFCSQSNQVWGNEIHIMGRLMGNRTAYICESCAEDEDIFDVYRHSV